MAAHAHLKNEFTEDEKYHNLMIWLILKCFHNFDGTNHIQSVDIGDVDFQSLNFHGNSMAPYGFLTQSIPLLGSILILKQRTNQTTS